MSKSINFIFGCHAHQPVGNFDFVFERSYNNAYRPFLDVLERYPHVCATLHFTGPLFDWFEAHEPAFLERLKALALSGQVEIMGGGYYEPLLCAIPERDAYDQIRFMQAYCARRFGVPPRGMWLTERVWEPHLARTLARAGIEYTALDDAHFLYSGLRPEELFGYYMTEDEGRVVKVFPIIEKLRYLVPFHPVSETIEWLRDQATEDGSRCAVLHDDYEKFGVWPGTNKSVYDEGWLEAFFQALEDNREWLRCTTYSRHLDTVKALGRTYITCASYDEMMTWALPTQQQRELVQARTLLKENLPLQAHCAKFMRGGFWRGFLAKYDEANNIQKRMLRVSDRLSRLRQAYPDHERLLDAQRLLHEGQCNCAYWHGVFGGLYLNHLRSALYEKLIAADQIMDAVEEKGARYAAFEAVDFDGDGNLEGILENAHLSLFFSPADGGTLFELDYKTQPFNIANTLTRREEVYHDQLREGNVIVGQETQGDLSIHEMVKAKEADLDKLLVYDLWRRVSFRDRFIAVTAEVESLWAGIEPELGDFATATYTMTPSEHAVCLRAAGAIAGGRPGAVTLEKRFKLAPGVSHVEVDYDLHFEDGPPPAVLFGTEFVVNLLAGDAADRYFWSEERPEWRARMNFTGMLEGISHMGARDEWRRLEVELRFSRPARLYCFPLDTVSQSEDGQERVHQGSVIIPCWSLDARHDHLQMVVAVATMDK